MIKMIAMDMDGTLLRSDNTISKRTKEALRKAQQAGIILVLASGRSYRKLMDYAQELEMDRYGGYLIEVNGIARYDLKNQQRKVYHQLWKQDALDIFHVLQPYEVEVLGMQDEAIYDYLPEAILPYKLAYRKKHQLADDHPWTAGAFAFVYDNRKGYPFQKQIQSGEEFPSSLNKISAAHLPDLLDEKIPSIKAALQDRYWLGLTSPGWLEIMPKHVTKGNALKELADCLQISMEEVMAFGDGENDIEMLQMVGTGVVMENALANVKEVADQICPSNNDDGIAISVEAMLANL